jgi:basic amino acid/polyamine antiporter, APA family
MGLFSLVVYGVGDMVGAGIYATIGTAAGTMGNAVWLAFIVSMTAAVLTGLSYACLASRYPRAGGAAYVTHRAFGFPFLSYVIGLGIAASGLTSMGAQTNAFADNFLKLIEVPRPVIIVLFLAFMTGVNLWGIRQSMWTNLICTTVEVGGLLFIVAVGARFWGSVNYLETPARILENGVEVPGTLGLPLLLSGAVLTFYAFIGFEDMLNVAEEVKEPERTMPRGIVLAQAVAAVIYISVAVTAVSVVDYRDLAQPGAPLDKIAARAAPWLPGQTYIYITLFAVANTMLINFVMGSRLLYGMARQRLVPKFLGKVHPTRCTPQAAILTLLAIVTLLSFISDLRNLASATSLLLLCSFIVVNGSLIALKLRPGEPAGQFEVPIVVPALGMLVNVALIYARVTDQNAGLKAPAIAASLIAGISALYWFVRPKNVTEDALAAAENTA